MRRKRNCVPRRVKIRVRCKEKAGSREGAYLGNEFGNEKVVVMSRTVMRFGQLCLLRRARKRRR